MSPDKQTLDELRINRPDARRIRPRAGFVVVVLAVLATVAGAVWWFNRPKALVVRTIVAQQTADGGQKTLLNASGYVTARRQATVSSKVTGKVVEVMVEEGMKVEAGQVLARIDASNVEKSLRLAEAQFDSASKGLAETRANLERIIERLLAGDTKVILAGMKLPPNYGREYTGAFQSLYPELAKAYKIPLMPFFLEGVATKVDLNQADGLHPTKAGYTIIVNSLWPVLDPLLQK